jgi:hypothetical protein
VLRKALSLLLVASAHLFVALSVLVPVALVALTTYLVLKIFVVGTD